MKIRSTALVALACLGSLCSTIANAQEIEKIIPPKPVYRVSPTHPEILFSSGVEGYATIVMTIDIYGNVEDAQIEISSHEEFGLAALTAATEWAFEPSTRNGIPFEVKIRQTFNFTISVEQKINFELGVDVFTKITEPIISSTDLKNPPTPNFVPAFVDFYPEELRGTGRTASLTVQFIIGPDGQVHNPHVKESTDKQFNQAALRAISHMRFNPIVHNGEPVYVSKLKPMSMAE